MKIRHIELIVIFELLILIFANFIIEESFKMRTVENLNELQANMKTLDKYILSKKEPEYNFGLNLVKKGTCSLQGFQTDFMENYLPVYMEKYLPFTS